MTGNDATAKMIVTTVTPTPYVKAVRGIYATAFQSRNLKSMMPKLNKVCQKMIDVIEAQREGAIECQDLFVRLTLDIIGLVAFDTNLGGLDGSRSINSLIRKGGYIIRERFTNPLKMIYCKLFPKSKEAQRQNAIIERLTSEWDRLAKKILSKEAPPEGEAPIWFSLRNLKDPETDKPIQYNTLIAEIAGVVIAGMDSTGHQLAWLFALLAAHAHVVQKLLSELEEHGLYGSDFREVTFEDLGELKYLTAVIKEAMRIAYIADASSLHLTPRDMKILGYRIPKNTTIFCPGTRAFNTSDQWSDSDVFRPERWMEQEDVSQKYFLGFSFGPRDCVGQRLALLELRLVVIKLLVRYELTLQGSLQTIFDTAKDGTVIEAKDGVWLKVKPRSLASQSHEKHV